MHEFRIRLEFNVEVESPSHIDAAFAAAEWLTEAHSQGRLEYLQYHVAATTSEAGGSEGTQFAMVDLEEVQYLSDVALPPQARWRPVLSPFLQSGRFAAWPYTVKRGDDYTRTLNGHGRVIRYASFDVAQRVADQLNTHEGA